MEQLILDAKKGGIRINKDLTIENITNWDLQSTIFLALQVMGSVGKSDPKKLQERQNPHSPDGRKTDTITLR